MLRLTEVALDVESEAAFGLLGAAARAAMPYLQKALAEQRGGRSEAASRPMRARASRRRSPISASSADGVRVDAAVTGLRLADIEFDAKTLRVIAEADGTVRRDAVSEVAITATGYSLRASRLCTCTISAMPNSGVARLTIGIDTKAAMNMPATKTVPWFVLAQSLRLPPAGGSAWRPARNTPG